MKRHYIKISIDNLPDDINEGLAKMPNELKVSFENKSNDITLSILLTELIKTCTERYPKAVDMHMQMLSRYFNEEVSRGEY